MRGDELDEDPAVTVWREVTTREGSVSMDEATVNIADVVEYTSRVRADEIRVGDRVFDVFGKAYAVVTVRHTARFAIVTRDDGNRTYFQRGETVTIVSGAWD